MNTQRFNPVATHVWRGLIVFVLPLLLALAGRAAEPKVNFEVPAGETAGTLKLFAHQAEREIMFAAETVGNVKTNAVHGEMTVSEGLAQLLASTGLAATLDPQTGAIAVKRATPLPETKNVESRPVANPAAKDESATEKLDTVEVTGTRIPKLAGQALITPGTTLTSDDIARYGVSSLSDLRRAIPQLGPNTAGNEWTTLIGSGPSPGLSNRTSFSLGGLNLASSGLGGTTLVLVDGRRLSKSGQVFSGQGNLEDYDLNGIPLDTIDRIEILTGGAGAIYGADAMAGVINIILKKNVAYNYTTVNLHYDNASDTDAADMQATLSNAVRAGKFSAFTTVSYEEQHALADRDRWYRATANLQTFGGKYDNRSSYVGAIWASSGTLPGLATTVAAIPTGSAGKSTVADFGAAGTPAIYDSATQLNAIDPFHTKSISTRLGYDYAPWLELSLDVRWNEKTSTTPYIPYLGYNYPQYTNYRGGFSVPAGVGGNPFGTTVILNKVFTDLKQDLTSISRNPNATLGARGTFHAWIDWTYDTYFDWARSEQIYNGTSGFDTTKLASALAAGTGPILIYDSAAGNPNAPGVLESYLKPDWNRETSDTSTYNFSLRGSVLALPAGEVQVVAGGEWMDNRAKFAANADSSYASYLLKGPISRDDTAVFGEAQIPVLSDKQHLPLVHAIDLNLSARHDDYSDVGGATTPRIAALYQPTTWLTFRGSRSEGFKPASLWDLNAPYYMFPYTTTVGPNTSYPLTDPLRNNEYLTGSINTYEVGHHDLRPTTSVSRNLGSEIDIPFVKGLSFSIDFTRTEITDAIGSVSYQEIINNYPDRVVRAASTDSLPGKITAIDTSHVNTASYITESFTYALTYTRPTRWGSFYSQITFTDPNLTRSQAKVGGAWTEAWLPKRGSGAVGWERGPLSLSLSAMYQGSFNMYPAYLKKYNIDYTYSGYIEWTPRVAYDFGRNKSVAQDKTVRWHRVWGDLRLAVSVANVFNSEPSLHSASTGYLSQDYRGRRFILDLTKKF